MYLAGYGLGRAWIEGLRTDQLLLPVIGLPVSQLLSIALVLVCTGVIFWKRRKLRGAENGQDVETKTEK